MSRLTGYLRPTNVPWAKITSSLTGKELGGEMVEDHGDGTVTILLGGFFKVRGTIIVQGFIHRFDPT